MGKVTVADLSEFHEAMERVIAVIKEKALAPNRAADFGGASHLVHDGVVMYMPTLANGRPEVASVSQVDRSAWDDDFKSIVAEWLNDPKFVDLSPQEMGKYAELMGIVPEHRNTTGFEFNGMWIHNPMISECGRFENDPEQPARYGFEVIETGGGCKGWMRVCENGDYLLLTDDAGVGLPSTWNEALLYRYTPDGDQIGGGALSFEAPDDIEFGAGGAEKAQPVGACTPAEWCDLPLKLSIDFAGADGAGASWRAAGDAENALAKKLATMPRGVGVSIGASDCKEVWFLAEEDGMRVLKHAFLDGGGLVDVSSRHDLGLDYVDVEPGDLEAYAARVRSAMDVFDVVSMPEPAQHPAAWVAP